MNSRVTSIPVKSSKIITLAQWLGRVGLSLLLTMLLLEGVTRVIWWDEEPLELFGRHIPLLPLPLVTDSQVETLDTWTQNSNPYLQFDPVLGWSIRPDV